MMPGAHRVPELLGQVKFEYDTISQECERVKRERDEFERKLQTQVQEMDVIQQTLKLLQSNQSRLKHQYEQELLKLTTQLEQRGGATNGTAGAAGATDANRAGPAEKRARVGDKPPAAADANSNSSGSTAQSETLPGISIAPKVSESAAAAAAKNGVGHMNWMIRYGDNGGDTAPKEGAEGGEPQVPLGRPNVMLQHQLDHKSVVCCVRFSADGTQMATGCKMKAQVFDVDSGEQVFDVSRANAKDSDQSKENKTDKAQGAGEGDGDEEEEYVRAVCFSPNGQKLLAAMPQHTIKIWDIASQKETLCLTGHQAEIYSLDYVENLIASGSGDKIVRLWDPTKGICTAVLGDDVNGPKEGITCVSLSPDARYLAAASLDKVIRIWDTTTQSLLGALEGHSESVYSIAFSPDGKQVVSGSLDCTLMLWDVDQCGLTSGDGAAKRATRSGVGSPGGAAMNGAADCSSQVFRGHDDFVLSVGYTPDGKWLISGSKDRSVMFWDSRKNTQPVLSLRGYRNSVISVASSSKSKSADGSATGSSAFATGSGDNFACIWKYTC